MTSDDESTQPDTGDSGTDDPQTQRQGDLSTAPRASVEQAGAPAGEAASTSVPEPASGDLTPPVSLGTSPPTADWYGDDWGDGSDYELVSDDDYDADGDLSLRKPVSRRGYIVGAIVILSGMIVSALILRSMVQTVDGWSDAVPIKAGTSVEMDLDAGDHDVMVMIPHTSGFDIVLSKDVEGSHLERPYKWGRSIDVVVTGADGSELTVEPNLDIASFANDTYRFLTVGTVDVPESGRYTVTLSKPELVAPIPVPEGLGLVKLDIQSLLTRLVIVVLLLPLTTAAGLLIMLMTYIRRRRQLRASSGQPSRFSSIFRPQNVAWTPTGLSPDDPALDDPALVGPALDNSVGGDPAGDEPVRTNPALGDPTPDSPPAANRTTD